jgi:hypothetical protein
MDDQQLQHKLIYAALVLANPTIQRLRRDWKAGLKSKGIRRLPLFPNLAIQPNPAPADG